MADRVKYAGVRQQVIDMIRKDLLGPMDENEVLNQNPRFEYLVGMLAPQVDENGDESLFTIDDDEEFDRVADFFDDMFSTVDFDEN